MTSVMRNGFDVIAFLMQRLSLFALSGLALALVICTGAAALGQLPWLTLPLTFGTTVIPEGGTYLQIGLTVLALGLCFFIPSNLRVMNLETSHRRFHIGMEDVARAYHAAHSADRSGVFTLKSEFDSVRARMAQLREHPDLSDLEPSVLEIAAQMSHLSRDLAEVYSERNVARARDFLIQRQQEVEDFTARLEQAKAVATDMRRWLDRVELDEAVAESQLIRLCDELTELLPELHEGATVETRASAPVAGQDDPRIVSLVGQQAAE